MANLAVDVSTLVISPASALVETKNPLLCQEKTVDELTVHLAGEIRHERRSVKAEYRDARQAAIAADAIGRIPGNDESIHMVISGRFALFDFAPAIYAISKSRIDKLTIATLGYSKSNIRNLAKMVAKDQIGNVVLLYSHYFRGTSKDIAEYADEVFAENEGRMAAFSLRTHTKLMLFQLADGRHLTIESSANLRSCRNIEQMTAVGGKWLYDFHDAWITDLLVKHNNGQ